MKRNVFIMFSVICCMAFVSISEDAFSQQRKHSTYYEQRATLFDELPTSKKDIVFLGNSITDGGEWSELFQNKHCKNRGISGDVCDGVLDRLETITKGQPAKVFLMIGINDLGRGGDPDTVAMKTRQIVKRIKAESPRTEIYIQSVLPTNDHYGLFGGHTARWKDIPVTNDLLRQVAEDEGVTYIDLFSLFADEEGKMNIKYSNDGLHLTGKGYLIWRDAVKRYL
ncbi:MAG: SGNH/GDSL hydrolase family protein [Bacteroidia bacterium]|nr:SGNH/GDSL hydrolase family protein [Bacteroidia bacterium]